MVQLHGVAMDVLLGEGVLGGLLNYLSKDRIFPHPCGLTASEDATSLRFQDSTQASLDFTGPDDPDMPRNWPALTKAVSMANVMLLNFGFYAASVVFTPSIPLLEQTFGATPSEGTLGLSLFVIAYRIGPLIVSELLKRHVISLPTGINLSNTTIANSHYYRASRPSAAHLYTSPDL